MRNFARRVAITALACPQCYSARDKCQRGNRSRWPVRAAMGAYLICSVQDEGPWRIDPPASLHTAGGRVLGIINVLAELSRATASTALSCTPDRNRHRSDQDIRLHCRSLRCGAIHLGHIRDLSISDGGRLLSAISKLPGQIENIIGRDDEIIGTNPVRPWTRLFYRPCRRICRPWRWKGR